MKKVLFLVSICLAYAHTSLLAQEKWDLQKCVDFALTNNITVKQTDLQAKLQALNLRQAEKNILPTVNANLSSGFQLGRSIDPTTNSFTNQELFSTGLSLQSSIDIYNWGRKKKTIEGLKMDQQAALMQIEKLKNDISLNVALFYLNALLAKEGIKTAEVAIEQTKNQLLNTRKRVDAGALPEFNAAQLEAQLSQDSSFLVDATNNERNALLSLKVVLNIDLASNFDILAPNVDAIPIENLTDLQPEAIYHLAMSTQPQQKINALRLKSAEKSIEIATTSLYPTISGSIGLQSNFIGNPFAQPVGTPSVITPTIGTVNISGVPYNVISNQSYSVYNQFKKPNAFSQLDQNFRQSIGINVNIPIFNAQSAKIGIDRARMNVQVQNLQAEADNQKLKQDIYQAYNSAFGAFQKLQAAQKQVETNKLAFRYAQQRADVGLLNTLDFLTTSNNLNRSNIDLLRARFDYVFKMKVLEFYKGQGIKL